MALLRSQQRTLAILPKFSGALSMIGSACIIKSASTNKQKMSPTYHRLLLGMSSLDFICSFWFFLSTWPVPEGSPDLWGTSGTTASCTAQGFFVQLSSGVPYYNGVLAIYYVLISTFRWSEEYIRAAEPILHGVPVLTALTTAVTGVALNLYNDADLWCWIASFPHGCKDSYQYGEEANCIRGDNAWIYRWAFFYVPVWWCILVSILCVIVVYSTVLKHEKAVDQFQEDGLALRKQSQRVAWQGFWYVMAFFITWVPATVVRLLQTIPQTQNDTYFPLLVCMASTLPLQGFLNFIVYSRSRYQKYKRENPQASALQAVGVAAFSVNRTMHDNHMEDSSENDGDGDSECDGQIPAEDILRRSTGLERVDLSQFIAEHVVKMTENTEKCSSASIDSCPQNDGDGGSCAEDAEKGRPTG